MPEPTTGDLERWLLHRGITLSEYERMPWVRRDFLYSEFRREWSEDPWTLIEKVLHNIDVLRRQVFLVETKRSIPMKGSPSPEIPIEVKESIKRFWEHFLRARGLLVPPIDVPRARVELQGALSEIGYQKGYMNPQDYEKIKTHLEWAIDFLNRDLVPRAITELEELFSFLVERMVR